MMRLRSLLPLAAFLFVGSCRDSVDPTAALAAVEASASDLFVPIESVIGVNSAGMSVRQGNGPFVIRTPFGGADETTNSFTFGNIDDEGTIFGWSSLTSIYYRKVGGAKIEVALPIEGEQRLAPYRAIGRTLSGGAIVITVAVTQSGVVPANEGVKLYRWSSGDGWQLIGTSLSVSSPTAYPPRAIGIIDDGAVAWARIDPNGNKNRLYRTALNGNVTFYLVPDGHTDGAQNAGNNGVSTWAALRADGALVGYSSTIGTTYPILWDWNGTPHILPNPGGASNYNARAITGNYIVGATNVTGHFTPVRWQWNGSTWDYSMFGNDRGSSSDRAHVNAAGMIASIWTSASPPGFTYGQVSDAVAFRPTNAVIDDQFIYVDAANRFWTYDGYFTPVPELTAPATLMAAVGVRKDLPLNTLHVLPDKYPMTWSVRWQYGVNNQIQEGTTHSNGRIPLVRHIYTQAGTWTARAIVEDADGAADTTFTTVTVLGSHMTPTASVAEYTTFEHGQDVVLDGSGSVDLFGLPITHRWQFDGAGSSNSATMRRQNVAIGTHTWRLIVTNSVGLADTVTGTVVVDYPAPTGRLITPTLKVYEASPFVLRVDRLRGQPGDAITVEFDCNDGGYVHVGVGGEFTCSGLGMPNDGTYEVGVRLTDAHARQREYRAMIVVRNKKPTVTIDNVIDVGPGQFQIQYTADDVGADLPLTAMFFVNGVRQGGTQQVPPSFNSPVLNANWGDVITVRVRDKTGANSEVSVTLIEP